MLRGDVARNRDGYGMRYEPRFGRSRGSDDRGRLRPDMINRTVARRQPPPQRGRRRGRRSGSQRRWLSFLLRWTAVFAIWSMIGVGAVAAYYAYDLPDVSGLNNFTRRPSLTFVSADGRTVATYGDLYDGPVQLRDMPPWLPQAVLATEDRRFYSHFGLDVIGIARAAYVNLRAGRVVQGGSTITQQLAKNVFLTRERTFGRKIQEVLLALWFEQKFTKDQILSIYLNRVYLGAGTYGVEAAARHYFHKSARQVTRREAALIAGLLKAPSRYAPTSDTALAAERADEVIERMVDAGYLSPAQAIAARKEPLRPSGPAVVNVPGARYFSDWLVDQVGGFIGMINRDLVVVTTLDPRLQNIAENQLAALIDQDGPRANASQGAFVAIAPDGAVRAMVGGRNYADSQFNRAASALRQPGSAFKPFVYAAAVEAGLRPDDRLADGPVTIGNWSPRNFDNVLKGDISAREAMARSVNTATVRAAQRVGIERVISLAKRFGIASTLRRDYSTALGASEVTPLELTAAYAPFANGGTAVIPYAITEIRDTNGKTVYRRAGSGAGRVISRNTLVAMTDMLSAVMTTGTGRAAQIDRPAAGKTGTSQEFRDAWFVGFTADLIAGAWFGNDDGDPMERVTGGGLPARLWKAVMLEAQRGLPIRPLPGGRPAAEMPIVDFAPPPPPSLISPAAQERDPRRDPFYAPPQLRAP
jgi:penicillin-binding protein 1A